MIIQLALSTADLAIQMEEWDAPVQQLVQAFGKDPEMVACLLEFLSLLPEEIMYNRKIKLEVRVWRRGQWRRWAGLQPLK